jgi:formate-dependent nitrite reductase cytochrome c552 subunit
MCNCKKDKKSDLQKRIEKMKKEIADLESKLGLDSNKKDFNPYFKD